MKSSYKKLGPYVQQISLRNKDLGLSVGSLKGIRINKEFMPSVANTTGTDLSKYRVVSKNQFAYNPMHVGRDEVLPISLLNAEDPVIVSPAYVVFEIKDTEELDPEYLMMWFRRSEFDRNAWFTTDNTVRGGFSWDAFCDMELPIPSIEKQREIVVEYNTVVDRIKLNETLNKKLEETAQAIYREWFVDFEFPDEDGTPYKSSGGEMVYCEKLDKDVPKGWDGYKVGDLGEVVTGKTPSTLDEENFGSYMPFITIPDLHNNMYIIESERSLSKQGVNTQINKIIPANSICVSCIGTAGLVSITEKSCQTNQQINSVVLRDGINPYFTFFLLKSLSGIIKEWGNKGSVGVNMNKSEFSELKIFLPSSNVLLSFKKVVKPLFESILLHQKEMLNLRNLKELLLSKIAK